MLKWVEYIKRYYWGEQDLKYIIFMLLGCSKWGVLLQADNLSLCLDSTLELTGSFLPQESERTDYFQEEKREIEENNIERHNLKPRWRNFLTAARCLMTTWSLLLILEVLADAHRGAQLAGKGLGWAAPGAGFPSSLIPPSFLVTREKAREILKESRRFESVK